MKTAVDELMELYIANNNGMITLKMANAFKQAKQMEKEQMIQFAEKMRYVSNNIEASYNKTYGNENS